MTNKYSDMSDEGVEQTYERYRKKSKRNRSRGVQRVFRQLEAEVERRGGLAELSSDDGDDGLSDDSPSGPEDMTTAELQAARAAYDRHDWDNEGVTAELRRRGETAELSEADTEVAELTAAGSVSIGELSDTVLTENVATDDDGRLVEPKWDEIGRLSRSTVENLINWYGQKMEELSAEYQSSDIGSDRESVVAEEYRKAKQYKNRLENRQ